MKDVICNGDDSLKLIFDEGKFIEMSLKWDDYEGPEAYSLTCFDGRLIVE